MGHNYYKYFKSEGKGKDEFLMSHTTKTIWVLFRQKTI